MDNDKKNTPVKTGAKRHIDGVFITKSNEFMALHKDMDVVQRNLLNAILTKIRRNSKESAFIDFHLKELALLMEDNGTDYDHFRKAFEKLKNMTIETTTTTSITLSSLIYQAEYIYKNMAVRMSLTPLGRRFFVEVDDTTPYTKQRFKSSVFSNVYAHEIWDLVSQVKTRHIKSIQIDLDEFRKRCQMDKDKYTNFYDFKRRILEPAIKEINKRTGMKVDFEPIKVGRAYVALRFYVISVKHMELYEPKLVLDPIYNLNTTDQAAGILQSLNLNFKMDAMYNQAVSVEYPFKLYADFMQMLTSRTGICADKDFIPEKFLIEDLNRVRKLRIEAQQPKYQGKKPKKTIVKKT